MPSLTPSPTSEPSGTPSRVIGLSARGLALLLLGLCCLGGAAALLPAARYCLSAATPRQLGSLTQVRLAADLANVGAPGTWVRGAGVLEASGLSFRRRGNFGSFVLSQLAGRPNFWLVLTVPTEAALYIPPRTFSGRLLQRSELGLAELPLANVMDRALAKPTDYVLLDGAVPAHYRSDLWACLLLAAAGFGALGLMLHLAATAPDEFPTEREHGEGHAA